VILAGRFKTRRGMLSDGSHEDGIVGCMGADSRDGDGHPGLDRRVPNDGKDRRHVRRRRHKISCLLQGSCALVLLGLRVRPGLVLDVVAQLNELDPAPLFEMVVA
jgi:hypothetical protein